MTDTTPQLNDGLAVVRRLQRLGLLENPFLDYPDARYFYPCIEHTTLYQEILRMAVDPAGKSLALVMGAEGTGKTTLARRLANSAFKGGSVPLRGVLVSWNDSQERDADEAQENGADTPQERERDEIPSQTLFVRMINDALGIETRKSLEARLELLEEYASCASRSGSGLFIVVDANLIAPIYTTMLEMVRWANGGGSRLMIRFAIFSSDNLFAVESRKPELKEWVGVRHTLGQLSYTSASGMIEARVRMAGRSAPLFTPDAISELVDSTQGHPGRLMSLARRAFSVLLRGNEATIDLSALIEAREEVGS